MHSITDIYALNEKSITIVFGEVISQEISAYISQFNATLKANPFHGFKVSVPAYTSLTIYYDPLEVNHSNLEGNTCFDQLTTYLNNLELNITGEEIKKNKIIIPVCYEGEFGADIDFVASNCNLSVAEVIQIHSSASYRVYMIGFVPGFAYMGGMDKRLSTPRRQQPRASVPAGAVGIAGEQTGIYPLEIPGGWQIIGQTPLKIFDANRPEPALLKAGDEIRFEPITVERFRTLS